MSTYLYGLTLSSGGGAERLELSELNEGFVLFAAEAYRSVQRWQRGASRLQPRIHLHFPSTGWRLPRSAVETTLGNSTASGFHFILFIASI